MLKRNQAAVSAEVSFPPCCRGSGVTSALLPSVLIASRKETGRESLPIFSSVSFQKGRTSPVRILHARPKVLCDGCIGSDRVVLLRNTDMDFSSCTRREIPRIYSVLLSNRTDSRNLKNLQRMLWYSGWTADHTMVSSLEMSFLILSYVSAGME